MRLLLAGTILVSLFGLPVAFAQSTETLYLTGILVPAAGLSTGAPGGSGAPNYDWWRNSDDGTTIERTGNGQTTLDSSEYQAFVAFGPVSLDGPASVTIHSAHEGFVADAAGELEIFVFDCNSSFSSCDLIGSGSQYDATWNAADEWSARTISVGTISHDIASGRRLVVKVTATNAGAHDMALAYGTATYPSRFSYIEASGPTTTTTTTTTPTTTTTTAPTTTTTAATTTTTAPPTTTTTTAPPTTTTSVTTTAPTTTTTTTPSESATTSTTAPSDAATTTAPTTTTTTAPASATTTSTTVQAAPATEPSSPDTPSPGTPSAGPSPTTTAPSTESEAPATGPAATTTTIAAGSGDAPRRVATPSFALAELEAASTPEITSLEKDTTAPAAARQRPSTLSRSISAAVEAVDLVLPDGAGTIVLSPLLIIGVLFGALFDAGQAVTLPAAMVGIGIGVVAVRQRDLEPGGVS